jgi:hypothetical protein
MNHYLISGKSSGVGHSDERPRHLRRVRTVQQGNQALRSKARSCQLTGYIIKKKKILMNNHDLSKKDTASHNFSKRFFVQISNRLVKMRLFLKNLSKKICPEPHKMQLFIVRHFFMLINQLLFCGERHYNMLHSS